MRKNHRRRLENRKSETLRSISPSNRQLFSPRGEWSQRKTGEKRAIFEGCVMRVTLSFINNRLAALGHEARLERGDGYFYVSGGEASDWLDRAIKVPTIASLTVDQWVSEFERLKKLNEGLLRPTARKKRT
jgi:hypothetical protein